MSPQLNIRLLEAGIDPENSVTQMLLLLITNLRYFQDAKVIIILAKT